MDNGRNSLIDIFSKERFYKVPIYQRSYAWEEKQLRDFYNDFRNDYQKNNYYYGTILLKKIDNEDNTFEIVDGQQRITTLVIFIYCLLKELHKRYEQRNTIKLWNEEDKEDWKDLEKKFIIFRGYYKLTLQDPENNFFHSCILSEGGNFVSETPAQKN